MYQFPYANVLALTTLCESEEMNFIRVFNSMSVLKLRSMRAWLEFYIMQKVLNCPECDIVIISILFGKCFLTILTHN